MFLDQLVRTLGAEEPSDPQGGIEISGPAGGDSQALSEIALDGRN